MTTMNSTRRKATGQSVIDMGSSATRMESTEPAEENFSVSGLPLRISGQGPVIGQHWENTNIPRIKDKDV